jgi:transcriptional regulator with XRE-family HTH domain
MSPTPKPPVQRSRTPAATSADWTSSSTTPANLELSKLLSARHLRLVVLLCGIPATFRQMAPDPRNGWSARGLDANRVARQRVGYSRSLARPMTQADPLSYARKLGENLRNVRRQQGLALRAVEQASAREFKVSVLGAYERGERIISVPRLQRLARLYGVPVDKLLPSAGPSPTPRRPGISEPVRVNLARLAALDAPYRDLLQRYVTSIQIQRGDFNGRVITIRDQDVRALGAILMLDETETRIRLRQLTIVDKPPP